MYRRENENWKTYAKRQNYFRENNFDGKLKLMTKNEILEYEKEKENNLPYEVLEEVKKLRKEQEELNKKSKELVELEKKLFNKNNN